MIGVEIASKSTGVVLFRHEFIPDILDEMTTDIRAGLISAILNIMDDYVRVAPADLRNVIFTYIKDTTDPVFGVSWDAGFPEYDPDSSTELEWNDENVLDIIFIMVKEFGVIATLQDVQNAAAKTAQKK